MKTKYFVVSSGLMPQKIYFDLEKAKESKMFYIDGFDKQGNLTDRYMRNMRYEKGTEVFYKKVWVKVR